MLRYAAFDISSDSDVENVCAAGHDVGVVTAPWHEGSVIRERCVVLMPVVMGADCICGRVRNRRSLDFAALRSG